MEIDEVAAPRIKRRFPIEIRIRTYIILAIFLPNAFVMTFMAYRYDATLFLTAVLAFFFVINHGLDWGYQLATDGDRIYQRPKGWRWFFRRLPWYAIRYDEASRIETIFGGGAAAKRHFFPFEFILVFGRTGAQGDNIVIYPPSFRDADIKQFLIDFHARRPELFPQDVIDYMYSERPL